MGSLRFAEDTTAGSTPDSFATPAVRLGLLGDFRLSIDAEEVPLAMNAQRLLSFLALQDRPLPRTFVVDSLWGDSTGHPFGGSFPSALSRLQHPAYSLIDLTTDHIALSTTVAVDVREGEILAYEVLDPAQDLDEMDANEVLCADLLPDWTEEWVLTERDSYHQLRLRALEVLCRRLTAEGRYRPAVQAGLAAVSGEPLSESARLALIAAHRAEGNAAAALCDYGNFCQLLYDELGIIPSENMRAVVEGPS
jgi:DNA-binding SARP family transcriptional activator